MLIMGLQVASDQQGTRKPIMLHFQRIVRNHLILQKCFPFVVSVRTQFLKLEYRYNKIFKKQYFSDLSTNTVQYPYIIKIIKKQTMGHLQTKHVLGLNPSTNKLYLNLYQPNQIRTKVLRNNDVKNFCRLPKFLRRLKWF